MKLDCFPILVLKIRVVAVISQVLWDQKELQLHGDGVEPALMWREPRDCQVWPSSVPVHSAVSISHFAMKVIKLKVHYQA